jgi:hypothetical protein
MINQTFYGDEDEDLEEFEDAPDIEETDEEINDDENL